MVSSTTSTAPVTTTTPMTTTALITTTTPATTTARVKTIAPATTTASAITTAPTKTTTPATTTAPATTMTPLATSILMSTRSTLTTGKWARICDSDNNPESNAIKPTTKRLRQVELPKSQFMSYNVTFGGPNTAQVHTTSNATISEFLHLVYWTLETSPQLATRSIMLKTNITGCNNEYLDLFGVEQAERVE
ncbi:hypothetical protein HOY80DRAFT_1063574 [Tuber brumale]|nr:hypothetical protein HOY80DRAFT_1063574 [Tuber brumale]